MKNKKLYKQIINSALEHFDIEIKRKDRNQYINRYKDMKGVLNHLKELGFSPSVAIDVGAAFGTWEIYNIFPDTHHILIEPLEEFQVKLEEVIEKLNSAEYILGAASTDYGEIEINVHPDLVGSSIYLENENSDVNGIPRSISSVTLDNIFKKKNLLDKGVDYLIKIDTQGSEIDVLKGAEKILKYTECVILETTLFEPFIGGHSFFDVIKFMKDKGFVAYEMFSPSYRPLDGAMIQIDIAFVKEFGKFRQHHCYANENQRTSHNQKLRKDIKV